MKRLGINVGRYHGERIEVPAVSGDCIAAAMRTGWEMECLPAAPGLELLTLRRRPSQVRKSIYLSAGIHGDEPAGPLACRQLLQEATWPIDVDLWLCPVLNPTGLQHATRENANGIDLNRDYRHLVSDEIRAHSQWLLRQPQFDLALCLHEDWEANGFYLYEVNPHREPSLSDRIIAAVAKVCPIDDSPIIDGRDAIGGIIRPDLDPAKRPEWPEAFFLITHKTRHGYTLEAPSDFPLAGRVQALVTAVRAVLEAI